MVAGYPAFVTRSRAIWALLAAALWAFGGPAPGQGTSAKPVELRTRTVDGKAVQGTISEWDASGCTGAFATVTWTDLPAVDVERALRKLTDASKPDQMLVIALALFATQDGASRAEALLKQALKKDKSLREKPEAVRAEGVETREAGAARRLRAALPQGREGSGIESWPIPTPAQREAALKDTRAHIEQAIAPVAKLSGMRWNFAETEYWLVYGDLSQQDLAKLGQRLDDLYRKVAEMMALPKGVNIFHGKAGCVVTSSLWIYRDLEKSMYGWDPPQNIIGLCHYDGPRVVVNAYRDPNDDAFMSLLFHEATHGFMHRYGTAVQLPMWASEGYCELVAARSFDRSTVDASRRPQGLQYLRAGNSSLPFFQTNGRDGRWPGENAVGYAVSYLTVCHLIDLHGGAFGEWVRDVKSGVPWEEAARTRFKMDARQLAERIDAHYRHNMR